MTVKDRNDNCVSCRYYDIKDDPGLIVDTGLNRLVLAGDQLYLGRAYLTLGRHAARISDLTEEEVLDTHRVIARYELACSEAYGAVMVTSATLMNNAYQQKVGYPHVHHHLRPRYNKRVSVNGSIFEDPNFGHHHIRDRQHNVAPEFLAEIAEPLRLLMDDLSGNN